MQQPRPRDTSQDPPSNLKQGGHLVKGFPLLGQGVSWLPSLGLSCFAVIALVYVLKYPGPYQEIYPPVPDTSRKRSEPLYLL